ncbi:MAG TPA: hypothetical protein VMC83_34765 [Streptosporangiaceae bacterium]|nr:hypothetical protein [Streptosporangiaceae bacterium]
MGEEAERPQLRSGEMPGFTPEDGPGPEWDADDVPAGMQDVPAGMQDDPAGTQDDPAGTQDDPAGMQDDPAGTPEAAWPEEERPATGEPRVDAALARLDELAARPVTEHRAVFEDVHRRLRDVLGELDTREQNPGDEPAAAGAERRAGR